MQPANTNRRIIIYCDGACSGNQFENNAGGWGAILKFGGKTKEICGGEQNTSNQRMELTACIKALESITSHDYMLDIFSDSAYLVNCMQQKWYVKWEQNGWKTAKKQAVENKDLWVRLLDLVEKFEVAFHKVEGHTGVALNERADQLAQMGMRGVASSARS